MRHCNVQPNTSAIKAMVFLHNSQFMVEKLVKALLSFISSFSSFTQNRSQCFLMAKHILSRQCLQNKQDALVQGNRRYFPHLDGWYSHHPLVHRRLKDALFDWETFEISAGKFVGLAGEKNLWIFFCGFFLGNDAFCWHRLDDWLQVG